MFFNQYPYLNVNDLNLDYLLKAIGEMKYEVENFVSINAIKYANPIQWDITRQYEKNTIVIDPLTGTAYISVAPVPSGVALTRDDYWTVVFDLGSFVTRAAQNFTNRWERETTTNATFSTPVGAWLVWGDVLYKALVNITAGDTYVVGSNIEHFTIEDLYNAYLNTIASILSIIGNLTNLNTLDKSSIVNAINEVISNVGNLSTLYTTDKSSIVNAINEVISNIGDLLNLSTTDKSSIVNAINEVISNMGDLSNLSTTDKSNIVNAINEAISNVGALSDLSTTDKSSIVNAINEVDGNVDSNTGKIGVLANLNTTDKSNLVNAINELGTNVNTVYPLPVVDATKHGVSVASDDNSAALNACINTYGANYEIYLPAGEYKFKNPVYLGNKARFKCDGTMKFTQSLGYGLVCNGYDQVIQINDIQAVAEAVVLEAKNDTIGRSVYFLPRIVSTNSDALTLISHGANYAVGIQKCDFYLNSVNAGRNGIWLYAESPSFPDWVNEVNFYNPWIIAPHAIVMTKGTNQTDPYNGNKFINFSTENSQESIQLHFAHRNSFENMRTSEIMGTGNQIYMDASCYDNHVSTQDGLFESDISDVGQRNLYDGILYTASTPHKIIGNRYSFASGVAVPRLDSSICDDRAVYITGDYNCGALDTQYIRAEIPANGSATITLPRHSQYVLFSKPIFLALGGNNITVTIKKPDGTTAATLNRWGFYTIILRGANWYVIGGPTDWA